MRSHPHPSTLNRCSVFIDRICTSGVPDSNNQRHLCRNVISFLASVIVRSIAEHARMAVTKISNPHGDHASSSPTSKNNLPTLSWSSSSTVITDVEAQLVHLILVLFLLPLLLRLLIFLLFVIVFSFLDPLHIHSPFYVRGVVILMARTPGEAGNHVDSYNQLRIAKTVTSVTINISTSVYYVFEL